MLAEPPKYLLPAVDRRMHAILWAIDGEERVAGAQYLRAFVEDVKASGLMARIIEKNGVRGVSVAGPAPTP